MSLPLFLATVAEPSGDGLFVVLLLAVLAAGVAGIVWSRKRGRRPPGTRPVEPQDVEAEEPPASRPAHPPAARGAPTPRTPTAPRAPTPPPPMKARAPVPSATKPPVAPPPPPVPERPVLPLEVRERTIQDGLEKTRTQGFVSRLAGLFRKELDESVEGQLEEILLTSDIGVRTAQKLLERLRSRLDRSELRSSTKVWDFLRQDVRTILTAPGNQNPSPDIAGPRVIAIVGVNGTGKTTTMGKLAHRYVAQGKRVHLVAADTFRAAAADQLEIWAQRSQSTLYRGPEGQDPASVAFDGVRKGIEDKADIIMVDTAGRLHTKKNLLDELKKILKVIGKAMPSAPHETLLVLDATTGQNAIQQAEIFHGEVGISGIVLTKLDGTAKGGIIIGICDMMQIPVRYVGVGETLQDLKPFDPEAFVQGLFGS